MGSFLLSPKILAIRADADTRMGTGHLMRCLALAQTWQADGGQVMFLSNCKNDAMHRRITDTGMEFVPIAQPHPAPPDLQTTLEFLRNCRTQQSAIGNPPSPSKIRSFGVQVKNLKSLTDAGQTKIGNRKSTIENKLWLVLDGYHFDFVYQQAIQSAGFSLLVIDDMAHLPAYHADIILNQNLGAEKLKYNCNPEARLLLGPRYALLRQEFLAWRGQRREITDVARKVLVTMGGGDLDNVTLKVIHALEQVKVDGLEAVVVVGGSNPHFQKLESAVHSLRIPIRLVRNVANMPELMAWADVAVTAGGSTCWELAFMGLPALILILADNQTPIAVELERQGVALNLGWHTLLKSGDIAYQLHSMIMSSGKREIMSKCGRQLVDGSGTMRVVRRLYGCDLELRPVRAEDCRLIWEWANDPVARALSFSTEKIPWKQHVAWFESKRTDPSTRFYMAINKNDVLAGQIRYQINGQAAVVSVSLAPEQRGRGYGAEIIRMGTRELWANTKIDIIHAYIKQDNIASIRAFAKAGFISTGMAEVHGCPVLHYTLRKDARP